MPSEAVFPIEEDIGLNSERSGEGVKRVKRHLASAGYLIAEEPSPVFDAQTVEALRTYQRRYGINPTGEFDEATYRQTRVGRCGLPDNVPEWKEERNVPLKSYKIDGNPYGKTRITYRIVDHPRELDPASVSDAIERAFKCWEDALAPDYRFERVEDHADIELAFFLGGKHHCNDGHEFSETPRGEQIILAHAFYPVDEAKDLGLDGQIHFNDFVEWTVDAANGIDLVTVAMHEIGHALGLGHSENDSTSIMHPCYTSLQPRLSQTDIDNIRQLYIHNGTAIFYSIVGDQGGGPPSSRSILFRLHPSGAA